VVVVAIVTAIAIAIVAACAIATPSGRVPSPR
jgi:hypothetical protein